MKTVLVTGAHGFLGRHTSSLFKKKGYKVLGIGHGHWDFEKPNDYGIDRWTESDIEYYSLVNIEEHLDCIVHCAGGSSVGYSVNYPLRDYHRTVTSSINVLEYIRHYQPQARFIYPSSAAVYGKKENKPLNESEHLEPMSPYGFHKKMVEDLCRCYSQNFGVSTSVVRFFSIYGSGLKKQLLWDACNKIQPAGEEVIFFGTGAETRDWIHVEDATALLLKLAEKHDSVQVINGGSGKQRTIREIIGLIAEQFKSPAIISFNQKCREGDPQHYWADISSAIDIGWAPRINLEKGLQQYVRWYREQTED